MTTFTFERKNGRIVKFYGHGHTGHASIGEDIVCAGISAASQQTAFGIINYLKVPCHLGINNDTGFLYLDLEMKDKNADISSEIYNKMVEDKKVQIETLMETLLIMLREIELQYPENLKIIEKEDL
ncbi:MAG: ribosomal-processing cysteine protease Prp [Fusobacteriaceae bacterium]|nr:ribosomal-processing cysteine protease Prp [Fusobacteriaceae bacterium]MBN2838719.1 ribosomal-processing cysteine protease Prp [Fusobacteriaceae bacterium]